MPIVVGMKFGAWTVLSADPAGKRAACRCLCGTMRIITASPRHAAANP
jgi:hypothetical protein